MTTAELLYSHVQYCEAVICFVTLLLSIYFSYKIGKVATISKNLRIVIIVNTIMCLVVNFQSSVFHFVPKELYSVEAGNYVGASLSYSFMLISHYFLFLLEFKYFQIAIERLIAYREKGKYESQGTAAAFCIFTYSAIFSAIMLTAKFIYYWTHYHYLPLDGRLIKTFNFGSSLWGLFVLFNISSLFTLAAAFIFYYIHVQVKKDENDCHSLNVRYEIEQTKYVLNYIVSLMSIVFVLLIAVASCYGCIFYYYFYLGFDEDTYEIKTVVSIQIIMLCIYNFTTMLFMIKEFPQLQKAINRDLPARMKIKTVNSIRPDAGAEVYFNQLQIFWDR
ncbi:unnamed protein product [Bursaphelenchus okinawaensis]|uniref:Uncharacterized protein n=1 Tax=Bursaphelenchus okinawaensis TaxID=465554 RepID=A0A811K1R7_9BILA|nr:unnamed protein product [Bursaphelenchus okinawaensis]CAG9089978.1 unnamed protein product [Bursaphelenchus okinawaensis]